MPNHPGACPGLNVAMTRGTLLAALLSQPGFVAAGSLQRGGSGHDALPQVPPENLPWLQGGWVQSAGSLPLPAVGQYLGIPAQPDRPVVPGPLLRGLRSSRGLPRVPLRHCGEPYRLATRAGAVPARDRFPIARIAVQHNAGTACGKADVLECGVRVAIEGRFGPVSELAVRSVRFRRFRPVGTGTPTAGWASATAGQSDLALRLRARLGLIRPAPRRVRALHRRARSAARLEGRRGRSTASPVGGCRRRPALPGHS